MARIRRDVVGCVLVHGPGGAVFLGAGDVVPEGVVCDAALVEPEAEVVEPEAEVEAEAVEPEAEAAEVAPEPEPEPEVEQVPAKTPQRRARRASKPR